MSDITFAVHCESVLNLHERLTVQKKTDPNEDFYKSLPMCIIDAVFSMGVKYQNVEKAEESFLAFFGLTIERKYPVTNEYTISTFLRDMATFSSPQEAADKCFCNRQRTSSTNGILKADAVVRVAKVFAAHKINTLEDFHNYANKEALDKDICQVKGQNSGIMLKYLYMLAGKAEEVKPDRHMVNFAKEFDPAIKDKKDYPKIIALVEEAVGELKPRYPMLTPRFLDFLIWEYMRSPKVWVLSVQSSLPNICNSFQDLKTQCHVYQTFRSAKEAFLATIKHYAFSSNLIFDATGSIKSLAAYTKDLVEILEGVEDEDGSLLTPAILQSLQDALCKAFEGKTVSLEVQPGRYDDGTIGVVVGQNEIAFEGYSPCNGYDPVLHTNIFDMKEEKHYFLHINPLFGYGSDDGTAELYIDLRKATALS